MLTISDIYKDDLPDDSIFVLEYPSSHRDNIGNPLFLVNSSRYLVSSSVNCEFDFSLTNISFLLSPINEQILTSAQRPQPVGC